MQTLENLGYFFPAGLKSGLGSTSAVLTFFPQISVGVSRGALGDGVPQPGDGVPES